MREEMKKTGVRVWPRTLYSQLLQHLEFALYLRGPIGIVAKSVNENLQEEGKHWSNSLGNHNRYHGMGLTALSAPHLDVLTILLLCFIFALLIKQPLLLALDEGLKVSPITI